MLNNMEKFKTFEQFLGGDKTNYMFFQNIKTIKDSIDCLLSMDQSQIDAILTEHNWISDHISTSKDDIEEVFNFLKTNIGCSKNEE